MERQRKYGGNGKTGSGHRRSMVWDVDYGLKTAETVKQKEGWWWREVKPKR